MSGDSPRGPVHDEFMRLFSRHQRQVYAYIATVLVNPADVEEVVLGRIRELWSKLDAFERDKSFVKWACGVAHLQILRFFRQQKRKPLPLEDSTIELLLADRAQMEDELTDRRNNLASCIKQLRPADREVLTACYAPGTNFKTAAKKLGRSTAALYHTLGRIRRALLECVNRRMTQQGRA